MKGPTLVIMAAGVGSRYGGLKQIERFGENGELIMDYSISYALSVGFSKVVFIINKKIEQDFKEVIGNRIEKKTEVAYVYQDNMVSSGTFSCQRERPWGTAHAVMSCMGVVNEPFCVINADDYYGKTAFKLLYDFLVKDMPQAPAYNYAMVGFYIENTLSDHGTVSRGICGVNEQGNLTDVVERTKIEKIDNEIKYLSDDGSLKTIPHGTLVSLNCYGFYPNLLDELEKRLHIFIQQNKDKDILKAEYFLPNVVGELIREGKANVTVLKTDDLWYGITYKEDVAAFKEALKRL